MAGEHDKLPLIDGIPGARCQTPTSSWDRGKGRGLISTPFTTLKMAVFAPMPRARVISAIEVKVGAIPKRRKMCWSALMESNTMRNAWSVQKSFGDRTRG